jgi:hypothetical protein
MSEAGANAFTLSPMKWVNSTNAIGMLIKPGRGGGTFVHKDVAFKFAAWEVQGISNDAKRRHFQDRRRQTPEARLTVGVRQGNRTINSSFGGVWWGGWVPNSPPLEGCPKGGVVGVFTHEAWRFVFLVNHPVRLRRPPLQGRGILDTLPLF